MWPFSKKVSTAFHVLTRQVKYDMVNTPVSAPGIRNENGPRRCTVGTHCSWCVHIRWVKCRGSISHTESINYFFYFLPGPSVWLYWWIDWNAPAIWILSTSIKLTALVHVSLWIEFMRSRWLIILRTDYLYGLIDLCRPFLTLKCFTEHCAHMIFILLCMYIKRKKLLINLSGTDIPPVCVCFCVFMFLHFWHKRVNFFLQHSPKLFESTGELWPFFVKSVSSPCACVGFLPWFNEG